MTHIYLCKPATYRTNPSLRGGSSSAPREWLAVGSRSLRYPHSRSPLLIPRRGAHTRAWCACTAQRVPAETRQVVRERRPFQAFNQGIPQAARGAHHAHHLSRSP